MKKRIRSNLGIMQIVPLSLALWMPFAQAGEVNIDVKGMALTGGNITGGTICKAGGDCTAILKYKGSDGTIKTVLLKGGEVKAGTLVSGKIGDGNISKYAKIENGIITGISLNGAKLTGAEISNVVINNAIVVLNTVNSSGGLQTQTNTYTTNIDKTLEATTLTSDDISTAIIDSATLQASSAKTESTAAATTKNVATSPDIPNAQSSWKGDNIKILSDFGRGFGNIRDTSNPNNKHFAPNGAVFDVVADVSQGG